MRKPFTISIDSNFVFYSLRHLESDEWKVLVALVYFRNRKTGQCDPTSQTLKQVTGLSTRRASQALHGLRDKGAISRQRIPRLNPDGSHLPGYRYNYTIHALLDTPFHPQNQGVRTIQNRYVLTPKILPSEVSAVDQEPTI